MNFIQKLYFCEKIYDRLKPVEGFTG